MWFESWSILLRILLVGSATYLTLIALLRLTGKRTLSQLNAFDFIVTVSMGSVLATVLTSADTTWAQGITALGLLAALQFVAAFLASRWSPFRSVVTSRPAILLFDGDVRPDELARHRLTESELYQAVRMSGTGDLSQVKAVVLETNGTFSVITRDKYGEGSALQDSLLGEGDSPHG
ncbi:hypothetical protein BCR15_00595 [Tessaracoccus lapidicaptus]|uniref:YetF C-terminal domain-containing protein n=1 Tax=Tessaracoccus lapidicaptus TaxID=1427523 RepID=A0A1C0AQ99_9ACTN|nr:MULTISPECIES: YetF domain-containing protein [Tessaracoccus]AQX15282.1 hypothetical protein BKM78_04560 [Tessaracoccus sp. T2.5-30]OCL36405.1 hypothetical protein BCR15_00595 [Tessaracoccus lapidicaptus]VEP39546.1 hypothetical protein TLA_TLA_00927 [Tessaracoccus lapidicaptus]